MTIQLTAASKRFTSKHTFDIIGKHMVWRAVIFHGTAARIEFIGLSSLLSLI
jgi:hypothetical protein